MTEENDSAQKECFVISPIGSAGSEERINADWVLKGIILPVLSQEPFNYNVRRADDGGPGKITNQIINWIHKADVIVADLTGKNENVFYELAIAHTTGRRVIPIMTAGETLPFDNYDERTIFYDRQTVDGVERAKHELTSMVRTVERPDFEVDNPVVSAINFQQVSESGDPQGKMIAELRSSVNALNSQMHEMQAEMRQSRNSLLTGGFQGGIGSFPQAPTLYSSGYEGIDSLMPRDIYGNVYRPRRQSRPEDPSDPRNAIGPVDEDC